MASVVLAPQLIVPVLLLLLLVLACQASLRPGSVTFLFRQKSWPRCELQLPINAQHLAAVLAVCADADAAAAVQVNCHQQCWQQEKQLEGQ
jgi:hypothetical protein